VQNVPLAMCYCKSADIIRWPSQRQRYYVMSVLKLNKHCPSHNVKLKFLFWITTALI
jgi:hypothetical protein